MLRNWVHRKASFSTFSAPTVLSCWDGRIRQVEILKVAQPANGLRPPDRRKNKASIKTLLVCSGGRRTRPPLLLLEHVLQSKLHHSGVERIPHLAERRRVEIRIDDRTATRRTGPEAVQHVKRFDPNLYTLRLSRFEDPRER